MSQSLALFSHIGGAGVGHASVTAALSYAQHALFTQLDATRYTRAVIVPRICAELQRHVHVDVLNIIVAYVA